MDEGGQEDKIVSLPEGGEDQRHKQLAECLWEDCGHTKISMSKLSLI